jgi:ribose transport system permease protein
MARVEPTFGSAENLGNISRNFAPFGIMALGMTVVHHHRRHRPFGRLDHGACRHCRRPFPDLAPPLVRRLCHGHGAGLACGVVNGFFVAYVGMPSFVVTLGMMSIARSLAVVFSGNQMLYQFGPDAPIVKAIGQAKWPLRDARRAGLPPWMPEFSSHFWVHGGDGARYGLRLSFHGMGPTSLRHRRQRAGRTADRRAGRLGQVFQAYVFSAFTASVAAILLLGYSGSALNALGTGYELRVIAATVIGGASLMGGYGTAFGAVIGAAFLEVIRNALLMAGIDSNWQGAFVGVFIIHRRADRHAVQRNVAARLDAPVDTDEAIIGIPRAGRLAANGRSEGEHRSGNARRETRAEHRPARQQSNLRS